MKPNKYQRRTDLYNRLAKLGFTMEEADKLRRIEKTLHRWAEHECNGMIQRDGDDCQGKPLWVMQNPFDGGMVKMPIADRERGALRRLEAIVAAVNKRRSFTTKLHPDEQVVCELWFYHQTDCRGCSVFIGRKSDLRQGQDLSGCYSSLGVAVCD